jgi:hypothetical protein
LIGVFISIEAGKLLEDLDLDWLVSYFVAPTSLGQFISRGIAGMVVKFCIDPNGLMDFQV